MKRLFVLLFCCALGFSLFAKEKTHSILFYPAKGELEFLSHENSVLLEPRQGKSGSHWYRIYFLAGKKEWSDIRIVVRPSADGAVKINLRAPGGSVAEYSSFTVNGKEMLEAPALIPYVKGQTGVWIEFNAQKDKDVVITSKIRRSPRKLSEFEPEK